MSVPPHPHTTSDSYMKRSAASPSSYYAGRVSRPATTASDLFDSPAKTSRYTAGYGGPTTTRSRVIPACYGAEGDGGGGCEDDNDGFSGRSNAVTTGSNMYESGDFGGGGGCYTRSSAARDPFMNPTRTSSGLHSGNDRTSAAQPRHLSGTRPESLYHNNDHEAARANPYAPRHGNVLPRGSGYAASAARAWHANQPETSLYDPY